MEVKSLYQEADVKATNELFSESKDISGLGEAP